MTSCAMLLRSSVSRQLRWSSRTISVQRTKANQPNILELHSRCRWLCTVKLEWLPSQRSPVPALDKKFEKVRTARGFGEQMPRGVRCGTSNCRKHCTRQGLQVNPNSSVQRVVFLVHATDWHMLRGSIYPVLLPSLVSPLSCYYTRGLLAFKF